MSAERPISLSVSLSLKAPVRRREDTSPTAVVEKSNVYGLFTTAIVVVVFYFFLYASLFMNLHFVLELEQIQNFIFSLPKDRGSTAAFLAQDSLCFSAHTMALEIVSQDQKLMGF